MEERRRTPRQSAVWMGACRVVGDPSHLWRDCGVFDFSARGVGMDFRYPDASDLLSCRIFVRLPVGGSIDLTLVGDVRNVKAGPDGIVRAGIEIGGLSEDELYIVDLLELGSLSGARGLTV